MLNILIPIAGEGSRFTKAGYINPKPFIEIYGKYMVLHVVDNIKIPGAKYIFLCQKSHLQQFGAEFIESLKERSFIKDFEIISLEEKTEGAACTALKAKPLINNNDELLIVNGDQILSEGDISKAVLYFERHNADAGILCFFNQHMKWSYVTLDPDRNITRIAEKTVISDHATCGIYYTKHGKYFVNAAEMMISKNDRVNSEFYIAPSFNYMILQEQKVIPYFVNEMASTGTPEDLANYLKKGIN